MKEEIISVLLVGFAFVSSLPAAYGEGEAQHLIQTAERGDAEAQARLAWISFEMKDMASVHKWLQMAVKQEHPAALCMAGELCVATGDDKQAVKYFNAAAKKGNAMGMYRVACRELFHVYDFVDEICTRVHDTASFRFVVTELMERAKKAPNATSARAFIGVGAATTGYDRIKFLNAVMMAADGDYDEALKYARQVEQSTDFRVLQLNATWYQTGKYGKVDEAAVKRCLQRAAQNDK